MWIRWIQIRIRNTVVNITNAVNNMVTACFLKPDNTDSIE
jgi:hypothetical protein